MNQLRIDKFSFSIIHHDGRQKCRYRSAGFDRGFLNQVRILQLINRRTTMIRTRMLVGVRDRGNVKATKRLYNN